MKMRQRRVALLMAWYVYGFHLGIAKYAREARWNLDATMAVTHRVPRDWSGDGILSLHSGNPEILGKIKEQGVPVVEMGNFYPDYSFPRVRPDNKKIGELAGEHLLSQGYRRIVFARSQGGGGETGQDRSDGLKSIVCAKAEFQEWKLPQLRQRLKSATFPLAIMAENDLQALDVLNICQELNLDVPNQVGVIGVDNEQLHVDCAWVPLSSVDSDTIRLGYSAARLLDDLMNGKAPPKVPILIPPKSVVERNSTDVVVISHLPTLNCLRFIRTHYREQIDFDVLAKKSGLCRRRMDDVFRSQVGRSMAKEVLRLRMRDACNLLCETNRKIEDIARTLGFVDKAHFTRVFRQEKGTPPGSYRSRHIRPTESLTF